MSDKGSNRYILESARRKMWIAIVIAVLCFIFGVFSSVCHADEQTPSIEKKVDILKDLAHHHDREIEAIVLSMDEQTRVKFIENLKRVH